MINRDMEKASKEWKCLEMERVIDALISRLAEKYFVGGLKDSVKKVASNNNYMGNYTILRWTLDFTDKYSSEKFCSAWNSEYEVKYKSETGNHIPVQFSKYKYRKNYRIGIELVWDSKRNSDYIAFAKVADYVKATLGVYYEPVSAMENLEAYEKGMCGELKFGR